MTTRVKLKPERKRAEKKVSTFTDLALRRLKPPKDRQLLIWDKGQRGLALLVSPGGTKCFRALFKLNGQWISTAIGRFGEMVADANPKKENVQIGRARDITADYRAKAANGIDPRDKPKPATIMTYGAVVEEFVEKYAKPNQRTWPQTQRVLLHNCKSWLDRDITTITKKDALTLLYGFIADGKGSTAGQTKAWLKKLWRWAWDFGYVAAPIMDPIRLNFARGVRDRCFKDTELKAIWSACDKLEPVEAGYVKLLVLLAPRKTALVNMRRSDLDSTDDPTLWTTPFEYTKSRKTSKQRTYKTQLRPYARRILKGGLKVGNDERV